MPPPKAWVPVTDDKRTQRINWEYMLGLPLAKYEDGTQEFPAKDRDDLIDVAKKFVLNAGEPQWTDPAACVHLVRVMQQLLSHLDYEGKKIFMEMQTLDREFQRRGTDLDAAHRKLEALQEQGDVQKEKVREFNEQVVKMDEEKRQLEDRLKSAESQLAAIKRKMEHQTNEVIDLRNEKATLSAEKQELERAAKLRQAETKDMLGHHESMSKERGDLIIRYTEAMRRIEQLEGQRKDHEAIARAEIGDLKERLEAARTDATSLREEVADAVQARNAAEELLDRRERKALADLELVKNEFRILLKAEIDKPRRCSSSWRPPSRIRARRWRRRRRSCRRAGRARRIA